MIKNIIDWLGHKNKALLDTAYCTDLPYSKRFLSAIGFICMSIFIMVLAASIAVGTIVAVTMLLSLMFGLGWAVFIVCAVVLLLFGAASIVGSN
jgi:hypothetical protein